MDKNDYNFTIRLPHTYVHWYREFGKSWNVKPAYVMRMALLEFMRSKGYIEWKQ